MSVLGFYRDYVRPLADDAGSRDENGEFVSNGTGSSDDESSKCCCSTSGWLSCDVCPQGKSSEVRYDDGTTAAYSYVIYFNHGCPYDFQVGERVEVKTRFGKTFVSTVKGYHQYEHSCQLWV